MKLKNIIGSAMCGLFFLATSCNLDHDPIGLYSEVTDGLTESGDVIVFKNKEAVESHLQTIYNQMRDRQEHWHMDIILLGDSHSDNAYGGSTGAEVLPFENNAIGSTNSVMKRDWERYLADIGRANKLIYGIDSVDDATLTDAERKQFKAEALIFRAMAYFDMVRIWGSVPLITYIAPDITAENIEEVYPLYYPKQSTEEETYKQIEQDLLQALESAPNGKAADKSVFSKSVARALLVKVYAEKPLRDYAKVIKYADEVTADGFDLVADFKDLFGMNDQGTDARARNTKEAILETHFFAGNANWVTWMFGRNLIDWDQSFSWPKWVTPSRDLVKAFKSEGDTKRLEESVVYYKCNWSIYYPADNYAFTYKYRSAYNSIIKFRYADILLLKAEAMIMKDSPDLVGAASIIDKVRERAGIQKLNASVKGNQNSMLEALLKERRLELAFEGQRWFDLVRLDKVEEVMNAVYAKDSGRKPRVNVFNSSSYRLPVPQSALDQNVNLVQNTGY